MFCLVTLFRMSRETDLGKNGPSFGRTDSDLTDGVSVVGLRMQRFDVRKKNLHVMLAKPSQQQTTRRLELAQSVGIASGLIEPLLNKSGEGPLVGTKPGDLARCQRTIIESKQLGKRHSALVIEVASFKSTLVPRTQSSIHPKDLETMAFELAQQFRSFSVRQRMRLDLTKSKIRDSSVAPVLALFSCASDAMVLIMSNWTVHVTTFGKSLRDHVAACSNFELVLTRLFDRPRSETPPSETNLESTQMRVLVGAVSSATSQIDNLSTDIASDLSKFMRRNRDNEVDWQVSERSQFLMANWKEGKSSLSHTIRAISAQTSLSITARPKTKKAASSRGGGATIDLFSNLVEFARKCAADRVRGAYGPP